MCSEGPIPGKNAEGPRKENDYREYWSGEGGLLQAEFLDLVPQGVVGEVQQFRGERLVVPRFFKRLENQVLLDLLQADPGFGEEGSVPRRLSPGFPLPAQLVRR